MRAGYMGKKTLFGSREPAHLVLSREVLGVGEVAGGTSTGTCSRKLLCTEAQLLFSRDAELM